MMRCLTNPSKARLHPLTSQRSCNSLTDRPALEMKERGCAEAWQVCAIMRRLCAQTKNQIEREEKKEERKLTAVKCAALPFERKDDVERGHGLALGVLRVGDRVADDVLEEAAMGSAGDKQGSTTHIFKTPRVSS